MKYRCSECAREFSRKWEAERHFYTHMEAEEKPYKCRFKQCNWFGSTLKEYYDHHTLSETHIQDIGKGIKGKDCPKSNPYHRHPSDNSIEIEESEEERVQPQEHPAQNFKFDFKRPAAKSEAELNNKRVKIETTSRTPVQNELFQEPLSPVMQLTPTHSVSSSSSITSTTSRNEIHAMSSSSTPTVEVVPLVDVSQYDTEHPEINYEDEKGRVESTATASPILNNLICEELKLLRSYNSYHTVHLKEALSSLQQQAEKQTQLLEKIISSQQSSQFQDRLELGEAGAKILDILGKCHTHGIGYNRSCSLCLKSSEMLSSVVALTDVNLVAPF